MYLIKEHKVIDIWYDLNLVFTNSNRTEVIETFLSQIFADIGLKIAELTSDVFKVVKRRCERIVDKIRSNKRSQKSKYNGFPDPEKTFFDESEFTNLFKKDVPIR